uniref:Uncharacterized protein n=1 Tax=Arundo donax TaxID=35708 RepID=A0A0A8Y5T2_ARUDO
MVVSIVVLIPKIPTGCFSVAKMQDYG